MSQMATAAAKATTVDVQNASGAVHVPAANEIRMLLQEVMLTLDESGEIEVGVRVVDEDEARHLNQQFRGIDRPTNVLSFPADNAGLPPELPRSLGDIVICAPIVAREAREQGKQVDDHWIHLLIHGALHLLGYDHESDEDALRMESLERELLAAQGVDDPYAISH